MHPRCGHGLRAALCAVLALCAAQVLAADPPAVLTAQTGAALEAAFAHAPAALTLDDAKIHADTIDLRACAADHACATAKLTQPGASCVGDPVPAFCVQLDAPPPPFRAELLRVLATVPPTVWHTPQAKPRVASPPERHVWLQPTLWAVLLLLVLLVGRRVWLGPVLLLLVDIALGGWLLTARPEDWSGPEGQEWVALAWETVWWLTALALGLFGGALARTWPLARFAWLVAGLAPVAVALVWPPLVLGDAAVMGAVAISVGLWHADTKPGRSQRWSLALLVLLAGLGGLEWTVRTRPRAPATVEDSRLRLFQTAPLQTDAGTRAGWVEALFAEPPAFHWLRAQAPRPPYVLHLGDSMLWGPGIRAEEAVPAQLGSRLQPWDHVNAGIPGATIDLEFALMTRLLQRWPAPEAIVLHAYPANDLVGLDLPLGFCGNVAPLSPPSEAVSVRCLQPAEETMGYRLTHSPLPLPLVHATRWSWLARWLVGAVHAPTVQGGPVAAEEPIRRYGQIAEAMFDHARGQHVPFLVVMAPARAGACQDGGASQRAMRGIFTRLGVPVLDVLPTFDAAAKEGKESALFLAPPDPHLSPLGAARYADDLAPWLRGQLPRR